MKTRIKRPPKVRSLTTTLTFAFLGLSLVALVISSSLQIFSTLGNQNEIVFNQQQLTAQAATKTVSNFIDGKFRVLEAIVRVTNPATPSHAEQEQMLEGLLGFEPAFRQLVLLNTNNQSLVRVSRLSNSVSQKLSDRLDGDLLTQVGQEKRYISPVYLDSTTSEPLVIIAIPVTNFLGEVQGTLAAEVNLKFLWDLMDQLHVGKTGVAYVVDRQGNLIAFQDTERVLKGENVAQLSEVREFVSHPTRVERAPSNISIGILGTPVISTHVPLGEPDWAVVTELPVAEAYSDVIRQSELSAGITLSIAVLAGLLGMYMARRLAVPLVSLTETATRIDAGELELQAPVGGPSEVVRLATAFNSMTRRLRETLANLEQRVADRTAQLSQVSASLQRRVDELQASAQVARAVTKLAKPEELIREVVELIREQFDFYYVGLFLVDADNRFAVLEYGTGEAGRKLKEQRDRLEIGGASMVGWTCANRRARIARDMTQETGRSANPLLPDTQSEMTLPLRIGRQVFGAVTIQSIQPEAFAAEDAIVFQTMADQIAVAIQNAQLHADVTERASELERAYQALQENQQRLLLSEKMALLGRLTAGIAHEMNTPLAAVRTTFIRLAELAEEYRVSITDPEVTLADHAQIAAEMQEAIRLAETAATRAASFVSSIKVQTRNFTARDRQRFNAVPALNESLLLLSYAARRANCTVQLETAGEPVELYGSPGQFAQVVTNLLTNSFDAVRGQSDGTVQVRLHSNSNGVELQVADNGCGIPADILPRIFDPMFTTKPFGEGTGLGLAIIHDIVTGEFGGTIQVASEPGHGTTFTIEFPQPQEAPDTPQA